MRLLSTKAEARLSKTQKSKRDNKQPIGKQHVYNQSEEGTNYRGGKGKNHKPFDNVGGNPSSKRNLSLRGLVKKVRGSTLY